MKEVLPGWLMVEVENDARHITIWFKTRGGKGEVLTYLSGGKYIRVDLPPGSYEIVGIVTEVSEEVAAGVVKYYHLQCKYKDYTEKEHDMCAMYDPVVDTATESIASLARSNGFEPERTLLIRKLK